MLAISMTTIQILVKQALLSHVISSDEVPSNSDDTEDSFSLLRLTITCAARSVLLKFEQKNVHQETVERLGLC